jgi:hypothetical protein
MANASEEFFAATERGNDSLHQDLKAMLKQHAYSHERHAQIELGPSQVGHPCARNIVSGLVSGKEEAINPQFDPLPSYIGVASHAAMEEAAKLDNYKRLERQEPGRWLPERKVKVAEGLSGTADLYDLKTNTVIDYKFPGTTKMTEYRKLLAEGKPPSIIYHVQAHLYGKGYRNEGYPVKRVGIWLLPRSGLLSTSRLWLEDYSEDLVQQQISRLHDLILLSYDMDLENHPERLAMIPITPYQCTWCPFFSVNPVRTQSNPYACAGGEEYRPPITDHSGAVRVD